MLTALVFAKDLAAMWEFYAQGLELVDDAAASSDGYRVLTGPGTRFALHAIPRDVAALITIADPPVERRGTPIKLIFGVADVARTRARLDALGARTSETIEDDAFDVVDPEGNVFGIRPFA